MKQIIALIASLLIISPAAARALTVYVQAEDTLSTYNMFPENIRVETAILKGLDFAEEWAEYQLETSACGTYSVSMRCWGDLNVPYIFDLIAIGGDGSTQTIRFSYTGKGSCGS